MDTCLDCQEDCQPCSRWRGAGRTAVECPCCSSGPLLQHAAELRWVLAPLRRAPRTTWPWAAPPLPRSWGEPLSYKFCFYCFRFSHAALVLRLSRAVHCGSIQPCATTYRLMPTNSLASHRSYPQRDVGHPECRYSRLPGHLGRAGARHLHGEGSSKQRQPPWCEEQQTPAATTISWAHIALCL